MSTAIALGANLGDPIATLTAVRPRLAAAVRAWAGASRDDPGSSRHPPLRWSPLFRTAPVGGPPGQPPYVNAVLLTSLPPTADPMALLLALQRLEAAFDRRRQERWGPRSLDLDLLWCGGHRCESAALWLPHPRWQQRAFVLAPLAALMPEVVPPGAEKSVAELLAAVSGREDAEPAPERLAPRPGWPE
ncbi:2-amino-4-hydroxy-6-hydroxymethyldihydropteridine diphosphokinase [Cyanobium sp. NIES-981]|uniref:2-amino-4-hydroxy-6- hydroxymethyldihydropteridine diphosphokinase n=1 Tax=Cyanobium sp. NIES-981 TaxID=1851505 RepID=UPI0007DDEBA4|nr:2-amino-4-hydroxy-6-hydroxymethyldihydropteridine diphosphokinase [Cyanobium sp. NIES-981]SBO43737.1 2-amino-4-hydroxy-6-hydroxymethyldihydropteridinepyrophosphokinase [Cyanobium sp. NIES-981]